MVPQEFFTISEIKEMFGVDDRFLETLERESIVSAYAGSGPEKTYRAEDAEKIRFACILMEDMGVNLEGVEVILHMREVMRAMREQMDRILECLVRDLKREFFDTPE